jgi:hypothetical protein
MARPPIHQNLFELVGCVKQAVISLGRTVDMVFKVFGQISLHVTGANRPPQLSLRMSLLRAPPMSSVSVSTVAVLTVATMIWPTSVFTLE